MLHTLSEFVVWNIHPNPDDETDMEILRERYIDEPEWFKKYKAGELTLEQAQIEGLKLAPKALES